MKDSTKPYFEIKDGTDFVKVDVITQNFPKAELSFDKNSVNCLISVKAGAYSGTFKTNLMTTDFKIFKKELEILNNHLDRAATFKDIESQITIRIEGDGIGHLKTKCRLLDYAGTGNELKCELDFDQTELPTLIDQLAKIITKFKVFGG